MKLIFATSNAHKLREILAIAPKDIEILSLADIGFTGEIPETSDTIEGNSLQKAEYLAEWLSSHPPFPIAIVPGVPNVPNNYPLFSEDTGLEIDALNGEPGVYSARYALLDGGQAGEKPGLPAAQAVFEDNIHKVLLKMEAKDNRRARFKTVITYYNGEKYVQFEGITGGNILTETRGDKGFGYDPIFVPDGYVKTYAEMSLEEKNLTSHRRKSFEQFANHLHKISVL